MLQRVLQRARPQLTQAFIKPVSTRLLSAHAIQRQESETLKPTSGKITERERLSNYVYLTHTHIDSLGFEATPVKDFQRPIYLDMQATSPTDPRVLDAMIPYMTDLYGNPHSRTHKYGWETEQAVEAAREVK